MGIRGKVSSGFVIIGLILFISGVIAVFEFSRMSRSMSGLISNNIQSMNTSRYLLRSCDKVNMFVLEGLGNENPDRSFMDSLKCSDMEAYLSSVRKNFTTITENNLSDSIIVFYKEYADAVMSMDTVCTKTYSERREWYYSAIHPVYKKLRTSINELNDVSINELKNNSSSLEAGFYRSIMPGVIAICAGIVLVLLFNYFINYYLISPIILISKGIKSYIQMRRTYNVTFDNEDELSDLNRQVKEIIDENKKLRKTVTTKEQ